MAEVAEVDRERRLRGPRNADEDDVGLVQSGTHAVVVLDRKLHRLDAPEVRRIERRTRARCHPRRLARDPCDGVDRMSEEVAVVDARAPTEPPHRVPHLRIYERVHDDGGAAASAPHRELEILHRLDARVPDLLELLVRELRFERLHEPCRGLSRGVGDDVQLDRRMRRHARILAQATS